MIPTVVSFCAPETTLRILSLAAKEATLLFQEAFSSTRCTPSTEAWTKASLEQPTLIARSFHMIYFKLLLHRNCGCKKQQQNLAALKMVSRPLLMFSLKVSQLLYTRMRSAVSFQSD